MCPGVRGIFCCFNEVVGKLLPGYEVFYDEHRDEDDDDHDGNHDDGGSGGGHGISDVVNVLFGLFRAENKCFERQIFENVQSLHSMGCEHE